MFYLYFTCLVLFVLFLFKIKNKNRKNSPPGPWGIPWVGFLIHMMIGGENYPKKLLKIKQKYGDMTTIRMGSFKCVWLNDYKILKEAYTNPIFCGRPKIEGITSRTHGNIGGLIFNDGPDFKEQRRFVVKHLRDIGSNMSMELLIMEEIRKLLSVLKQNAQTPISTRHLFNISVMNVLWRIITGEIFDHDDPIMIKLSETLNRNMELNGGEKLAFFMPWITKLCPSFIGWNKYVNDATFIFNFWREYTQSKLNSYDPNSIPEYFIDFYIQKIHNTKDINSGFYGERGGISLATTIQDLFIAGMETTATTLTWALLYLAVFPSIQEKVFEEIKRIIGYDVLPDLKCRVRMVYTEAFIQEVMRFGTLAPLGIIHRTTEDSQFHGYFIQKDTIIQSNISAIHNDPQLWDSPELFQPERFLDNERINLIKKEYFLPFSHGGRHCLGELMARDELFLFITSILQTFLITTDPTSTHLPSIVPIVGVGSIPKHHKLVFYNRKQV